MFLPGGPGVCLYYREGCTVPQRYGAAVQSDGNIDLSDAVSLSSWEIFTFAWHLLQYQYTTNTGYARKGKKRGENLISVTFDSTFLHK